MPRPEPQRREDVDGDRGRPHPRGRRAEEEINLWCESYREGLQDKSDMHVHMASKQRTRVAKKCRERKKKERIGASDEINKRE